MRPGDHLIYVADPLKYGVLELFAVAHDGRLWCEQLTTGDVQLFDPHDVDLSPELYLPDERRAA
jgi:sugar lactone lactonase YvrE